MDTRTKIKGDRTPILNMEAGGGGHGGGFGGGHGGGFGRGGVEVLGGGYPYPYLDYPDDGGWEDGYYPAPLVSMRRRPLMNAEIRPYLMNVE